MPTWQQAFQDPFSDAGSPQLDAAGRAINSDASVAWVRDTSGFGVAIVDSAIGKARGNSTGGHATYFGGPTFQDDGALEALCGVKDVNQRLYVRCGDPASLSNNVMIAALQNGAWSFSYVSGGTVHGSWGGASVASPAYVADQAFTVRVEIVSDVFNLYHDGTLIRSVAITDAALLGDRKFGIGIENYAAGPPEVYDWVDSYKVELPATTLDRTGIVAAGRLPVDRVGATVVTASINGSRAQAVDRTGSTVSAMVVAGSRLVGRQVDRTGGTVAGTDHTRNTGGTVAAVVLSGSRSIRSTLVNRTGGTVAGSAGIYRTGGVQVGAALSGSRSINATYIDRTGGGAGGTGTPTWGMAALSHPVGLKLSGTRQTTEDRTGGVVAEWVLSGTQILNAPVKDRTGGTASAAGLHGSRVVDEDRTGGTQAGAALSGSRAVQSSFVDRTGGTIVPVVVAGRWVLQATLVDRTGGTASEAAFAGARGLLVSRTGGTGSAAVLSATSRLSAHLDRTGVTAAGVVVLGDASFTNLMRSGGTQIAVAWGGDGTRLLEVVRIRIRGRKQLGISISGRKV